MAEPNVICETLRTLRPNERAIIYSGITSTRDLGIVADSVRRCGFACEVERDVTGGVTVFGARRKEARTLNAGTDDR